MSSFQTHTKHTEKFAAALTVTHIHNLEAAQYNQSYLMALLSPPCFQMQEDILACAAKFVIKGFQHELQNPVFTLFFSRLPDATTY